MSSGAPVLVCVSGPDAGKRVALGEGEATLGRDRQCAIRSDDADLAERHVALFVKDGEARYRTIGGVAVLVDGQPGAEGRVRPGQELRVGRSCWRLDAEPAGLIERLSEQITAAAGLEKVRGFSVAAMFSEVFKRRSADEIEDHLIVGTRTTTRDLATVDAGWPRPWLFFKAFVLTAVVYALFVFGWDRFHNLNLVPGLIMVGSLAVPLTLSIFFFEVNVVGNVSLYQVLRLMLVGGGLSLIVSLFGFQMTNLSRTLGPPAAGIIEEAGKATALLLVVNLPRYPWTLNGMLFGAAVGTGFAVFESAGYAFRLGVLAANSSDVMLDVIQTRGLLSIFGGHTLWTALVGGALWRVRGDRRLALGMLGDARFLRVLAVAVATHMLWNTPVELPLRLKQVALGFVVWVTMLSLIQDGLRQVRTAQLDRLRRPSSGAVIP